MKKLMYFATALLVLAGCNKKDNALNNAPEGTPFQKGQQVTLSVGTGDNANQAAPRKVAGIDAGSQINFTWEEGDKILVIVGTESAEFTLISGAGTATGEFTGTMPASGSTFDIKYPVGAFDMTQQVYTSEKPIPADKMAFAASNCTLGNPAALAAQYAMLQLNLYGTDMTIGKIVIKNITANPIESYTLTLPEGGVAIGAEESAATSFYMVVSADTYKFKVGVFDAAETPTKICSFATSDVKTFVAGECMNMPAKEVADAYNGYALVDLGLSVDWATCNIGATTPEGYGGYYAWGETETKTSYSEENYTYKENPSTLPLDHDAAHVNWGGTWRMPTYAELDELKTKCTWTWTTLNNIKGHEVKGPNNNTIFLPAAGNYNGSSLSMKSSSGYYYSSLKVSSSNAYYLYFGSGQPSITHSGRYYGRSVRPVVD